MDANQHASLPVPDAEALARSTMLCAKIASEIRHAGGWLPFSRFMEMALYTPGLGYYSAGNIKFGRTAADGSDFVTAPELSPFFSKALSHPIAEMLALADVDEIIEFGAGTGKLAAELMLALDALDDAQPADAITRARRTTRAVRRCQRYTIVELSGELRERQRATIERLAPSLLDRVQWVDTLPHSFSGVVLGNEVLDAMPVRLFPRDGGQWFERGVALDGTRFVWRDRPSTAPPPLSPTARAIIDSSPLDYLAETHEAGAAFVRTVCTMLDRGAVLLIDYGFPAHEYYHPQRSAGTLMCHYRHHAHGDPLLYPGLQDITAHVDFSELAQAALEAGADVLGYMSQARFLINAGIVDELSRAVTPAEPERYLPAAGGVQRLLAESEMGELFKVIGFGKGMTDVPQAFIANDRSWTLLPEDDADEDR